MMTKAKKKAEKFWMTIENKETVSPKVAEAVREFLALGGCQITLDTRRETRRDIQNRLAQVFSGQIAKKEGLTPDYAWGMLKWDILRRIKYGHEDLSFEAKKEEVIVIRTAKYLRESNDNDLNNNFEHMTNREIIIECANEYVRSKDLPLDIFAEFITAIQAYGTEIDLVLESNKEDLFYALTGKRGGSSIKGLT